MAVIRQHKRYSRPRKLFEKTRIEGENVLMNKYGLKNKKEIWKADSYIERIRVQAKKLITASQEKQEEFIARLAKLGMIKSNSKIDDVLALTKESLLERRLQTLTFKKGLAKTIKEARQLINHRHILLDNEIVTIPSRIVLLEEENKLKSKEKKKKEKQSIQEMSEKGEEK
jgi:small subunit ribosomal protein S4